MNKCHKEVKIKVFSHVLNIFNYHHPFMYISWSRETNKSFLDLECQICQQYILDEKQEELIKNAYTLAGVEGFAKLLEELGFDVRETKYI